MSMEHKAFDFDWESFQTEFFPIICSALASGDKSPLLNFIELNHKEITDPYEGEALDEEWQTDIAVLPIQEVADFALTKYYSVVDEFGIGESWIELSDKLNQREVDALLGSSIQGFDPGGYGSYFQSLSQLRKSIKDLTCVEDPIVKQHVGDLSRVTKGLYVTF